MKLPDAMSDQEATAGQGAQAMARTLGTLFVALRVVIVLALLSLAFGGLFAVKENEEAMLFHFGRLEARHGTEILRSGNWYWAWPYPIDEIKRIPAQRSISITSRQFWPKLDPNNLQALQGGPVGPGAKVLRAGEDGYLLTGDANIMHMAWTLTYRIAEPKAYYLNFYEDPETLPDGKPFPLADRRGVELLIQSVLDDAVLGEVASWRVEDVLVSSRAAVPGLG
ncbi:MAG: SPFH domain-containing protein, partial [bacterium]